MTTMALTARRRTRVAILGGGLGGLAAAFELTSQPGWADRYEVTVYQKGWRLGGKGASGRSGPHDRIEEHGLHCFWGFYDNAFGMLRTCYGELARTTGLKTVDEAFKKLSSVYFIDRVGNAWRRYEMHFPETSERPGEGPRVTEMSVRALLHRYVQQIREATKIDALVEKAFEAAVGGELDRKLTWLVASFSSNAVTRSSLVAEKAGGLDALDEQGAARDLLDQLKRAEPPRELDEIVAFDARVPDGLRAFDKATASDPSQGLRRKTLFEAVQLGFFMVAGMIADGVPRSLEDFDHETYDGRDLRAWLADHGAGKSVLRSQVVTGLYNASFCYPGGDFDHGNLAAGVSLRTVLLMGFTYKGAFMWKMEASMGDTVFAPLYEALSKRGVTFEFFHKVRKLSLEPGGAGAPGIGAIELDIQAVPKGGRYDPLYDVAGLPCWPAEPLHDRIVNGEELRGFDLESDWCSKPRVGERVLKRGAPGPDGFDVAVLAIPVGGLPAICAELVAASPDWKRMVAGIETIRTQSFQLWLNPNAKQKAWQDRYRIMTDVYENPFNSIADMSQTLAYETWPAGKRPGSVIYFSTAMPDDPKERPKPNDAYQTAQNTEVEKSADRWLRNYQGGIFGWLGDEYDEAAYGERYHRANVSADQRYTLSVAGSAKARLAPDGSGFENLFLAGDWTRSPLNLGCAEGATMSGMLAGRGVLRATSPAVPIGTAAKALGLRAVTPRESFLKEAAAPFIDLPGMPVYPPAYRQKGITLCQFVLAASHAKMQESVDRSLNAVGGDRFVALGSWVVFQTGHIAENRSDGVGQRYGTGKETSATFLVPVVRMRGVIPIDVGMYAPFIFVDHPLSLIAGREVLGMAKHLATFVPLGATPVRSPTQDLDNMTIETMVVSPLGPSSPVEQRPLLELCRPSTKRKLTKAVTTFPEVIDGLLSSPPAGSSLVRDLLQNMVSGGRVPFFSLRQLRDVEDPTRAAFQEITRGVMQLGKVDVRTMAKGHTLTIASFASHPIAESLGLGPSPITPVTAVRIEVDQATLVAES